MGGDPDETISSRLGKFKVKCGGTIPWTHPIRKILDKILNRIDPNHSIDAIEFDEGSEQLVVDYVKQPKKKAIKPKKKA
jgi:hypothetical protein